MLLSTAEDCVVVVVVVNATAAEAAAADAGGSPKDRADEVIVAVCAGARDGVDATATGFIPKVNDGAELADGVNVNPVVEAVGFGVDVNVKADPGANEPTVDCGSFGAKLVTVLGIAAVGFCVNCPVAAAGAVVPNPPKGAGDGRAGDEPLKNPPNTDGIAVLEVGVDCGAKLNPPRDVGAAVVVVAAGAPPNENPPAGAGEAPNENPPAAAILKMFGF